MKPNKMHTKATLALGLAAATLLAQGCVFSIGSGNERHEPSKTRLTSSQQSQADVVRSSEDVPSFSQAESARLGKLGPDTTVDQFRKIFPEAVFRGSKNHDAGQVLIYEVRDRRVYRFESSSYGHIHDEPVFFRFIDDTLEGWYHSTTGANFPQWWLNLDMDQAEEG